MECFWCLLIPSEGRGVNSKASAKGGGLPTKDQPTNQHIHINPPPSLLINLPTNPVTSLQNNLSTSPVSNPQTNLATNPTPNPPINPPTNPSTNPLICPWATSYALVVLVQSCGKAYKLTLSQHLPARFVYPNLFFVQ